MKKKVNVFGKGVPVLAIFVLGLALVSAALVSYISNPISGTVDVDSPITITVASASGNVEVNTVDGTYSASIHGGESFSVDTSTEVHIDGITGHIAENKITGLVDTLDGLAEGITVLYEDTQSGSPYFGYVWELPVCVVGTDAYFYIGDSTETLSVGTFTSTTTFEAALDLDPTQDLNIETKVILADKAVCLNIPAPIHIAP